MVKLSFVVHWISRIQYTVQVKYCTFATIVLQNVLYVYLISDLQYVLYILGNENMCLLKRKEVCILRIQFYLKIFFLIVSYYILHNTYYICSQKYSDKVKHLIIYLTARILFQSPLQNTGSWYLFYTVQYIVHCWKYFPEIKSNISCCLRFTFLFTV